LTENSLLQHLYADLTDQQIIYKILHERDQLTPEAITVAKEELAKRNINIEQLTIAKETEEIQEKEYANFKLTKTTGELIDLLKTITAAKEEGKADTTIIHDLKKQGIDDGITLSLIKEATQQCKDKLDKIQADLFLRVNYCCSWYSHCIFFRTFFKRQHYSIAVWRHVLRTLQAFKGLI